MSNVGIASKVAYIQSTSSPTLVESGEPIVIHGIFFSTPTNVTVTVATAEGSTFMTFRMLANKTFSIVTPFIADNGIQFSSNNPIDVTVFHAQLGR